MTKKKNLLYLLGPATSCYRHLAGKVWLHPLSFTQYC